MCHGYSGLFICLAGRFSLSPSLFFPNQPKPPDQFVILVAWSLSALLPKPLVKDGTIYWLLRELGGVAQGGGEAVDVSGAAVGWEWPVMGFPSE